MDAEEPYFAALKLFLVFGPLLGFAVLELVLLRRDKRRAAQGMPLLPARPTPGMGGGPTASPPCFPASAGAVRVRTNGRLPDGGASETAPPVNRERADSSG